MDFHPSLRDVHPSSEFWIRDGPKLKNLYQLEHELRRMSDAQFMHHVNDSKNDFYNWIFHVVKDEKLSVQLAQVKVREAMADVVERHITMLEKVSEPEKKESVKKKAVKKSIKKISSKVTILAIPKITLPKVVMPAIAPELPPEPAVAPLPLSFEEVEARIRKKVGEMPDIEMPHLEMFVSHVHAEHKPIHHKIHHHVKKHCVHYSALAAGLVLGVLIAKYFI